MSNEKLKKKKWLLMGCGSLIILFIVFTILGSCLNSSKNKDKTKNTTTPNSTTTKTEEKKEESKPTTINFIFDVPTLVGKNIDEIRNLLGDPIDKSKNLEEPTQEQINLGADEWDNTFRKDDFDLLATFNVSSRKVVDFFVSTSSKYPDKNKLMEVINTKDNADNYKIEAVKALKNPDEITGIKIIP